MKALPLWLLAIPLLVTGPADTAAAPRSRSPVTRTWPLHQVPLSKLPPGFVAHQGRWGVSTDRSTPKRLRTIEQSAKNANPVFNVLLARRPKLADLTLRVRVRAVSGKLDQGGGLIWRARDARSYYITRFNPLENNLRLYTVKNGRRRRIAGVRLKLPAHRWFSLTVKMVGSRIRVYLNGKKRLDVRDRTFTTGGRVGLWTKADARTHFTDLRVRALR